MKKRIVPLLVVLVSVWITLASQAQASSNLQIGSISYMDPHIETFEPLPVLFYVVNPDSVEHFYKVNVDFEGCQLETSGYINGGETKAIELTLVPLPHGNHTIRIRLYQDSSDSWVDEKTKNVVVEKGYYLTQIENLNNTANGLEADNSILKSTVADLTSKLTYVTISLLVTISAVGIAFWWVNKKEH